MINFDCNRGPEYLAKANVKVIGEYVAGQKTDMRLLVLHYTRTSGTITTQAALVFPDKSMSLLELDMFRSVVANVEQWSDAERVNEMIRSEIAHYFFTKVARSSDELVLFRHDLQRLLDVRFYLRHWAQLNRLVLADIDNPRMPVGVNERETGMPDRMVWTDECRGKLDDEVYFIRRTLIHDNVPNLTIEESDKVNRNCFVDIQISGRGSRKLRIEKSYPLIIWPTADDILKEYAESIRRMNRQ